MIYDDISQEYNKNLDVNDRDCAACLTLMIDPCRLPCGHRICMSCAIDKSIERKLKCPIDG